MYADSMTTFQLVTLIVGVLLPILVALVTRWSTPSSVRSILLLFLSGMSGILNEWLSTGGGFDWERAIWGAVTTFIIGVATLYGCWKPLGVSDAAKRALIKDK